jgi:hypothetical protein
LPKFGAELQLGLTLSYHGFDVSFPAGCKVVRANPAVGSFSVQFCRLGTPERELMQQFIDDLESEAAVGSKDAVRPIATPASPEKPRLAVPARRWSGQAVAMMCMSLLLCLGAVVYAGLGR